MAKRFPERVQDHIYQWYKKTEGVRNLRNRMLAEYANKYYDGGWKGTHTLQPLNLIDRGVQIIAPFMVMQNPRVLIQPRAGLSNPYVRPFSLTLELALAHLFGEIRLAQRTLRPLVIDSLFGMGITKTGTWHEYDVEIAGHHAEVGQPYCDRIDFNDYVADIAARSFEEMKIEGNKYRLPLEYVQSSGLFKHYDRLSPDLKLYGQTDPERIAKPEIGDTEYCELQPTVELFDVWLPKEGVILTLPPQGQGDKVMREVEWDGPEGGPYDKLCYKVFPNSVIPIAPVYTWLDINKIVNTIAVKMKEDACREKTIGVYPLGEDEDADRMKESKNGDLVGVRDPEVVKELTLGGFNEKSMPFLQYLEHQYAISYSNLYGIGGRGSQAETLGQEQMLQYNATRALDDMVDQFHMFVRSITRKLAWFVWQDPMIQVPVVKNVEGMQIPETYSQKAQEGDFFDYTFDIDPYSMSRMNPEMKYQKLLQFVTGVLIPLTPLAQQQGSQLDVDQLVRTFGEYLGENIDNWWISAIPPMPPNTPSSVGAGTPEGSAQGDDRFGATLESRKGNLGQFEQSDRSGKSSPPQE